MNLTSTAYSPSTGNTTTSTVTISDAVAAGDLLVATVVTADASPNRPTVQDGNGHAFTFVNGSTDQPGGMSVWLFYLEAPSASAANSLTVTCTTHSGSSGLVVEHVAIPSGSTVSVLASAGNNEGDTSPSIGPLAWTQGISAFVYGAVASGGYFEGTTTPDSGFIATYDQAFSNPGTPTPGLHTLYAAGVTSGSATPGLTAQDGTYWAIVGAVFGVEQPGQLYLGGPSQGVAGVVSGPCSIRLGARAPSGGVTVAIASSDPSDTFALTPGGSAITSVTVPQGSALATFRDNLSSTPGTHDISASAAGYTANGSPLAIGVVAPTSGSLHLVGECQFANTSGTATSILGGSSDWGLQWRFRADTATGPSFIVAVNAVTKPGGAPFMVWNPTNRTATITIYGGGGTAWTTAVPILLGLDYHFLVAGGTTPTLYCCGAPYDTAPWSGAIGRYATPAIGCSVGGQTGVAVDHRVSDFAIWGSYSPTAAEASSLATGDISPIRTASPADAWWTLGGTAGDAASLSDLGFTDLAGGNNTLTVFDGSPSAVTYGAAIAVGSPVQVNAIIPKWGKLAIFGTCVNQQAANGGYPLAPIPAAPGGTPTIRRGGTPVSIGPAVGSFANGDAAFVAHLLECGGVQQVAIVDGGEGYTSPVVTATGGATFGTPVLESGVTSYVVQDGGQWPSAPSKAVAGPPNFNRAGGGAGVQVDLGLTGSAISACVPAAGGILGCGSGYDPTHPPSITLGCHDGNNHPSTGMQIDIAVSGGAVSGLSFLDQGSNYPLVVAINYADATGSGGWALLNTTPFVMASSPGSGYTNPSATIVPAYSFTGTTTSGQAQVTGVSDTSGLLAGMMIIGAGMPAGATIASVGSGTITLSAPATASTNSSMNAWTTARIRPIISNYIARVPVTAAGDYTAPPTLTVTDPGGSPGRTATLAPIMAGATAGDVFTYDAPASWLVAQTATSAHGGLPLGGIRAVSGASMTNSVGRREPAVGGFGTFAQEPTMLAGANLGEQPGGPAFSAFMGKNRYKQGAPWTCPGVTNLSLNPNGTPAPGSWPPGATLQKEIYDPGPFSNNIDNMGVMGYVGQWTAVYDDANAGTANAVTVSLTGGSTATLVSSTTSGTTTTLIYDVEFNSDTSTWSPNVKLNVQVPTSVTTWPLSNVWVVAPDAITRLANPVDRAKPFAADDSFIRAVTAPGGKAIGCIRAMDVTQGYGGVSGYIWPWDLLDPDYDSWGPGSVTYRATGSFARYYNTNPAKGSVASGGDGTYAWPASTKVYGGQCWFTHADPPFTITGTLTAGSTSVTNLSSNALMVGSTVTGTGVPSTDAYGNPVMIVALTNNATNFSLSAAATASGAVTLTITNPPYITIPPGNDGQYFATDQNAHLDGVIEFRSALPHGLTTGRSVSVFAPSGGVGLDLTGTSGTFLPTDPNGGPGFVTGPYTIAIPFSLQGVVTVTATSGGYQTVVAPGGGTQGTEIDLTAGGTLGGWQLYYTVPDGTSSLPYEFPAYAAAQVGCGYWLNIPARATDALVKAIAAKTTPYIGDTVPVYLEFSNEIWNGGGPFADHSWFPLLGSLWSLTPTYPPGTRIATYYTADGATPGDFLYGTATPLAAHHYDTFVAAWTAAGLDPSRVKRIMGSAWNNPNQTASICNIAAAGGFNFDGIAVGPYMDTTGDPSLSRACLPPGVADGGGSWPVEAINDFYRYFMAYGSDNYNTDETSQSRWAAHTQGCRSSGLNPAPRMVCYEGGPEMGVPGIPYQPQLLHDCAAHPSFRDVEWGWYAAQQRGDQSVADSGATLANVYQLYNFSIYPTRWVVAEGPSQPAGDGLAFAFDATGQHSWPANQFATIQGGLPADNRDHNGGFPGNTSPALQGLRDWFEVSSPPPPQPPNPHRPRRWFPGLGQASSPQLAR